MPHDQKSFEKNKNKISLNIIIINKNKKQFTAKVDKHFLNIPLQNDGSSNLRKLFM